MTASTAKAALRKRISAALSSLPAGAIAAESSAITKRLLASELYRSARTISCFLSMPDHEFQTREIVQDALKTKTVLVPRVTGKKRSDMEVLAVQPGESPDSFPKSNWGIPEPPLQLADETPRPTWREVQPPLDLVLVPGVAFTAKGRLRLGHGRGYYDTFLESLFADYDEKGIKRPKIVGLCLACQVVAEDELPVDPWDKVVDEVFYGEN